MGVLNVSGGYYSIFNVEELVLLGVVVEGFGEAFGLGVGEDYLLEGRCEYGGDEPRGAHGVEPIEEVIEEQDRRDFYFVSQELQLGEPKRDHVASSLALGALGSDGESIEQEVEVVAMDADGGVLEL